MVKTRRSAKGGRGSPVDPKMLQQAHLSGTLPTPGIHSGASVLQEAHELVTGILLFSIPQVWHRILPIDDKSDPFLDISQATGASWTSLLPLLATCGLIGTEVTSVVKNLFVVLTQWDEIVKSLAKHNTLHLTILRRKGKPREHFYCLGTPFYSSPAKQALHLVPFSADRKVNRRRSIIFRINTLARKILNSRLRERVSQNPAGSQTNNCSNDASNTVTDNHLAAQIEQQISFALALDLERRPRLSRTCAELITVDENKKQSDERSRHLVVHTAVLWGWRDPYLTLAERNRIAIAACCQVAYDAGYRRPLAHTQLPFWVASVNKCIVSGESTDPLSPSHCGKMAYLNRISNDFPNYIHELFRYAQQVKGVTASFAELAETMNAKSAAPAEFRPTLSISRRQLANWFTEEGGQVKATCSRPLLSPSRETERCQWVHRNRHLFVDDRSPVAFLDEKWFYTTSRRKSMKVLPTGKSDSSQVFYNRPQMRNRRFPTKIMYMGVVACPRDEHGFDGRVFLKRVSRRRNVSRSTRNKNFCIDAAVNYTLAHSRDWENMLVSGMTVGEAVNTLADVYDLDQYISERLIMVYATWHNGTSQQVVLEAHQRLGELGMRTDEAGRQELIQLCDIALFVQVKQGDIVDEDCSCDSKFMLQTMPEVGAALRSAFSWVRQCDPIFLVMDNAGGHGTTTAKEVYTQMLMEHNVRIIWQVPQSPETNMLDLGVWRSIQSAVEKLHHTRRSNHAALAASVEETWRSGLSEIAFKRVFGRLNKVMDCILEDEGGNKLVEQRRGLLFRDARIGPPPQNDDTNQNAVISITEALQDLSDSEGSNSS